MRERFSKCTRAARGNDAHIYTLPDDMILLCRLHDDL